MLLMLQHQARSRNGSTATDEITRKVFSILAVNSLVETISGNSLKSLPPDVIFLKCTKFGFGRGSDYVLVYVKKVKVARRAYSIAERRVPELIPVLGSQPAADASHIPSGRLPLLSARPAVTLATLKNAATNFAAW